MDLIPFKAIYPKLDLIASNDTFFKTVKVNYPTQKESGMFHEEEKPGLYIYQIETEERKHLGVISCVDIENYISGKIKKHEKTLAAKEQRQAQLLLARKAAVKPVLLTYPDIQKIEILKNQVVNNQKPLFEVNFEENKEFHRFWAITDEVMIQKFITLFKTKVPSTYIADGHHRSAASQFLFNQKDNEINTKNFDNLFVALFPSKELKIWDYNRIVTRQNLLSSTKFMAMISNYCNIKPLKKFKKPKKKHTMVLYFEKEWYRLKWKKKILNAHQKDTVILDTNILDELILTNILDIKDIRLSKRIKYMEGKMELNDILEKSEDNRNNMVFFMYPVDLQDMFLLSDKGKVMPPKSTFFEPRMMNGLLVKCYN